MEEETETPEVNSNPPLSEFPIDLLQNFRSGIDIDKESPADESKDIELNLGLSLGGCFGVDPSEKRLVRSSSLVGIEILQSENERLSSTASRSIGSVLMRACSVPTEAEENWRKRKEIHSLRRMELKRRRAEKQRNSRAARRASLEKNNEKDMSGQNEGLVAVSVALHGFRRRSQGSPGSQGDISLTLSDFNSRHSQGLSSCMEAGSLMGGQHSPKHIEQKPVIAPTKLPSRGNIWDNPSNNQTVDDELVMEKGRNVMKGMPSVSTRGEGPSGKKIEGFLYKYRDGEEVRIVCLCHGSFLSPAEFVKHAGGGDVAHPLRHIVVNTSSSSFL